MVKSTIIASIRELTMEQRADLDDMYEENATPSQASARLDIPLQICANYKKAYKVRIENENPTSASSNLTTTTSPRVDDADALLNKLNADVLAGIRRSQLEDEISFQRQKRRLELRQIRLDQRQQEVDIKRQELDIYDQPLEEPLEATESDENEEDDSPLDTMERFEDDPLGAALGFVDKLIARKGTQNNQTVITMPNNMTDEQIDAEISKANPTELVNIKSAIGSQWEPKIREGIKAKYGLDDAGVERVIQRLKVHK